MNLCCISLDRYFAITAPLMYVTKRSKKLALTMVTVAWTLSAVIVLPAVVGWKDEGYGQDETICYIPRAPGYVVYSACGSFFIPLVVMLYVYFRIFRIAYEREKNLMPYKQFLSRRNSGPTRPENSFVDSGDIERDVAASSSSENAQSEVSMEIKRHLQAKLSEDLKQPGVHAVRKKSKSTLRSSQKKADKQHQADEKHFKKVKVLSLPAKSVCSVLASSVRRTNSTPNMSPEKGTLCKSLSSSEETTCSSLHSGSFRSTGAGSFRSSAAGSFRSTAAGSFRVVVASKHNERVGENRLRCCAGEDSNTGTRSTRQPIQSDTGSFQRPVLIYKAKELTSCDNHDQDKTRCIGSLQPHAHAQLCQYGATSRTAQQTNEAELRLEKAKAKERAIFRKESKAAKTLAIVVGAFTVCWLPFFLQYIVGPFCDCEIPHWVQRFFVWLGYFNSICNPAIYALYNRAFRHSFWKLTFGQCVKGTQQSAENTQSKEKCEVAVRVICNTDAVARETVRLTRLTTHKTKSNHV